MLLRALILWGIAALPLWAGELQLLMVEKPGCPWCARWEEEVGRGYARSDEGQAAPLMRVRLHAALPEPVALARAVSFTPTFILLDDGREIGRIEGYPGADFFWPMLDALIVLAQTPAGRE
ncbi:hypothetical protein [Rhodobacter lacus]|uniref:Regulatory protein SoxS n=1 Tax=Rhodobacter lacus TaxID=1641972 RepID=A0ABW5ADB0_9RHOB